MKHLSRVFIAICFIILYAPIIVLMLFSFNSTASTGVFAGFSLYWYRELFRSSDVFDALGNTLILSLYNLIFSFPIPIIFALALNEMRCRPFKRVVQTVSYLPHFISVVVIVGMLRTMLSPTDGVINNLIRANGGNAINFFGNSQYFRPLYIGSGVWQTFGWNSIIYLAALTNADPSLYEAARIDGANRWQQLLHVSIPCILPTMIILLIMQLGRTMSVGYEKIILMYEPATYEVADVISTYVYRRGIVNGQYSFATAIGLFNSVINMVLLIAVNTVSRRISEVSLW